MYAHTSSSVQLASGLAFHRLRRASQASSGVSARAADWSRRTPEIQQSAPSSARPSGSTLRRKQQRSGSVAHRPWIHSPRWASTVMS